MTPAQKELCRQLTDLVNEKFGTVTAMCKQHHYRYTSVRRFLLGANKKFDEHLYESIRQHCQDESAEVNQNAILLEKMIGKYYYTKQNFCREAGIHQKTLDRILLQKGQPSKEFKGLAFIVYTKALMQIHGIENYVNNLAPGKYLKAGHRRQQNLYRLGK